MTHVEYVYLDDNWNVNIFQVLFCSPRDLTVADKTFVTRIQVCSAGFFKGMSYKWHLEKQPDSSREIF